MVTVAEDHVPQESKNLFVKDVFFLTFLTLTLKLVKYIDEEATEAY